MLEFLEAPPPLPNQYLRRLEEVLDEDEEGPAGMRLLLLREALLARLL